MNRDGAPNKGGIEEICKVANWKPEGGATPTPTSVQAEIVASPAPRPSRDGYEYQPRDFELDDEIPF